MKTKLTRILLFLLVSVLVLTAFAGCNKDDDKDPTDTDSKEVDTSEGDYDENGYLKDALPNDLSFGFDEVSILGWTGSGALSEFDIQDMEGDEIEDSIFERDSAVEERIKVELTYYSAEGDNQTFNNYKNVVQNAILDGKPFDVTMGYTRSIAACATNGLLADLANLDNSYIDWEAPWWNQSIREKTSIGNSFFFTTGDMTPSYVQWIYCVYFNVDLVKDLGLTSPYDHVKNNNWTLETFAQMTQNYYEDLNTDNKVDAKDKIPLSGSYYDWPALLHGCDIGNVVKDEATGLFIIDPNLGGEKGLDVMSTLSTMVVLDNCYVSDGTADCRNSFIAKNSLFLITESSTAAVYFSEVEFEYGCVPCPKYDSEQENYISTARQPVTLVGISDGIKDSRHAMITATLEAMASEAYRSVTPVVFDKIMQYQKSASQEMTDMLTLIRETGWFDCGRIHAADIDYLCDKPGRVLQAYPQQTWATYVNGTLNTTVKSKVELLNETLLNCIK